MDSRLPYDVDSVVQQSWPFPTSCSLDSVSFSDDCDDFPSGGDFPSTGTIPILLFDGDADDLLGSDPASLSPQFGVANNTRTGEAGSSTGYRGQDCSSGALLGLGAAESSAVRGSSGKQPRGGSERNHFNGSHRPLRLTPNPVDPERPSGLADDKGEVQGRDLSLFFGTGSPPSFRSHYCRCCCCCCSPPSRSSPLSCPSQVYTPDTRSMRRTCYGSRGAPPAAISSTQLITTTKKHRQGFSLETFGPQSGQPSFNLIALYDCVEQLRLPLTSNHDHDHCLQQDACAAFSSTEADLSIDFPPRDRTMGRGLLPPYFPTVEPSSSSSSSNLNLPHHLTWLQNITISLCIDQEGFRAIFPTFKLVGYTKPTLPIHSSRAGMQKLLAGDNNGNTGSTSIKQLSEFMDQASTDPDSAMKLDVGMAEFMPLKRESFVFHYSTLDTSPSIRRLSVNGDESRDYLSQHAYLSIKSSGGFQVYAVRGSEVRRGSGGEDTAGRSESGTSSSSIKLEWQFEYTVEDKRKADGTKVGGGEKLLTPLRLSCSPGLLHSGQGRKVTVLSVWKKSIQPRLVAGKVEPLTITSPTISGNQTYNLTGTTSPPTSPKGVGVGPLRFPTTSKLWGKRVKSSPYRFDKGSDGSEEDLIPSEDSANRRRRRRPTSAYFSRVSQEAERPLQKWDGDRGQSTDAVRQTNREARPATAGAERSGRWSKTQSLGRGATSEGEDERVMPRCQGGFPTPQLVYGRRPRTAR